MAEMTEREYECVLLGWEFGYQYAVQLIAEAVDDLVHVPMPPPWRSYEQRVAERVALFEACAERIRDDLRRHRERERARDRLILAQAGVAS